MIEFNNVSKTYDNGAVGLKDVNIHIDPGEFVFVVGASGAGKSTFLKLIIREEVPTQGTIRIKKYLLNNLKRNEIPYYRRRLGVVFQDFRLIQNMNVYDNIAFAMRVIGAKEKDIRKRVPYVISLVGLSSKARCMPLELSGGEQQRVALARALTNNADIIIADEPTGNVDPQMSYEIVALLTRLNDAGTTVIMVTHEHELVRHFSKRVIILENGTIVSDGCFLGSKPPVSSQEQIEVLPREITDTYISQKPSAPDKVAGPVNAIDPNKAATASGDKPNAKTFSEATESKNPKGGDGK